PDLDRRIAASRDQESAVGAERHAADEAGVAAKVAHQRTGVAVPDLHGAVLPRRGDPPAIFGAERHGVDLAIVSPEGSEFLAGLHVPDLDGVLLAPRRQPPAVRAEGHVQTRPGNPRAEGEAGFLLLVQALLVPARRVPEVYLAVAARRSQVPAVPAGDPSSGFPAASTKRADPCGRPGIPDLHLSTVTSRDQVRPVGVERQGVERRGAARGREREGFLSVPRVPDLDGMLPTIPARRGDPLAAGVPGQAEDNVRVGVEL